ncbi:MAG TPA: CRISPR-associated endonuclease Cas1 [Candidatus Competibacter sp.]|nr:CRISPR-associated endonuclease Cas1 [Candidatus Competibacter sp.]
MSSDFLLILDRRDMRVRLEGNALRVEQPDANLQRIPLGMLGLVVVHGAPAVTCDVWRALSERGIPAVLVPTRGQGRVAWLGSGLSNTIQFRRQQHRKADRPGVALAIARQLVGMKLRYQRRLATGLAPWCDPPFESPVKTLLAIFDDKQSGLASAADLPAVMGFEGAAAAAWYGWLASNLPPAWGFGGRNRRPPRDPVNALLSLGYTLLGGEMFGAVQAAGLDPALGFLHGVVPGRESLVLDLIEPLRPGVDAVVLGLLDRALTPHHFIVHPEQGCRLNKEGRGLFYRAWAEARWRWPLPISPDAGLSLRPDDVELQTDGSIETAGDASLGTQCRRMVRVLRALLRSDGRDALESFDEAEEEGDG